MEISFQTLMLAVGAGSAIAVAVFQGAFYMGKIWNRLDEHDRRLEVHDAQIAKLGG